MVLIFSKVVPKDWKFCCDSILIEVILETLLNFFIYSLKPLKIISKRTQ